MATILIKLQNGTFIMLDIVFLHIEKTIKLFLLLTSLEKYNELDLKTKNKIKYIIVDGTLKPSASVA